MLGRLVVDPSRRLRACACCACRRQGRSRRLCLAPPLTPLVPVRADGMFLRPNKVTKERNGQVMQRFLYLSPNNKQVWHHDAFLGVSAVYVAHLLISVPRAQMHVPLEASSRHRRHMSALNCSVGAAVVWRRGRPWLPIHIASPAPVCGDLRDLNDLSGLSGLSK